MVRIHAVDVDMLVIMRHIAHYAHMSYERFVHRYSYEHYQHLYPHFKYPHSTYPHTTVTEQYQQQQCQ